jgi:hypothetical protein
MDLVTDLVTPAELTGYARAAQADRPENQPSLAQHLPDQFINDLNFRFSRGGGALTEVATYRAYDAESPLGSREGFSTVTGQLPPLSRKMRLSEYDSLVLRNATAEQRDLLLRDAVRLTRQIDARLEVARGDALVNGSVTIAENGVQASVNFGRRGDHSVTAAILWSDVTGTTPGTDVSAPIDDLLAWQEAYTSHNGMAPGVILTSNRVRSALQRHPQIKAEVSPNATSKSVSINDLNGFLNAYGLPSIETYDVQFSTGRVIADNKLLFLPGVAADLGATLWGTTLESQEADYGIAEGGSPGIVVAAWKTRDPIALWTHAAAIGLPILGNPDLSFVATVL